MRKFTFLREGLWSEGGRCEFPGPQAGPAPAGSDGGAAGEGASGPEGSGSSGGGFSFPRCRTWSGRSERHFLLRRDRIPAFSPAVRWAELAKVEDRRASLRSASFSFTPDAALRAASGV